MSGYASGNYNVTAEHDEIWVHVDDISVVTTADRERLSDLGWDQYEDWNAFHKYV